MIYLDNAATTFKKPQSVISAVDECLKKYCGNPGRSSHFLSMKTSEMIYETREIVSRHLGVDNPERVIFFQNATHALNFAIKSSINDGDHVIISDIEHNATLRPVHLLESLGKISYSIFSSSGNIIKNITDLVTDKTTCIITTGQSNAFGREIDLEKVINLSNEKNLTLIIDAAQVLGHKKVDLSKAKNVVLCAPAHKGLFGIQGCGFSVLTDNKKRKTFVEGGSGSNSKSLTMPDDPPERYEAGTLSSPAIISLLYGLKYVEDVSVEIINKKINDLSLYAKDIISSLNGAILYESGNGIISFNLKGIPCEIVSYELNKKEIYTRAGLHCAPLAHRTLGTYDLGTVRASLSYFNKRTDISRLYKALKDIRSKY